MKIIKKFKYYNRIKFKKEILIKDFSELEDLINKAIVINWNCFNSENENPNPSEEMQQVVDINEKLWNKFNFMVDKYCK